MMLQYLKDVQAVQRKIAELSETIEFINEVHCDLIKLGIESGISQFSTLVLR